VQRPSSTEEAAAMVGSAGQGNGKQVGKQVHPFARVAARGKARHAFGKRLGMLVAEPRKGQAGCK